MTIQEYPTAATADTDVSPAVELVADFAYWQLVVPAGTTRAALEAVDALRDRLLATLEEIWPAGVEHRCPFDGHLLSAPRPDDGTSWCPFCIGRVDPAVRAVS